MWPRRDQPAVDLVGDLAVLVRVRGVEVVERDAEAGEVAALLLADAGDQLLGRDAFLPRLEHDRRAVRVARPDEQAVVAAHALEAHPDVGLDVLDDVAEVRRAVGVRQGAGDEQGALGGGGHGAAGIRDVDARLCQSRRRNGRRRVGSRACRFGALPRAWKGRHAPGARHRIAPPDTRRLSSHSPRASARTAHVSAATDPLPPHCRRTCPGPGEMRQAVRRMDAAPGAPRDGFTASCRVSPGSGASAAARGRRWRRELSRVTGRRVPATRSRLSRCP